MARRVDYDAIANVYDRRYERNEYGDVERALLHFVGSGTPRVLEVGCGTGHWLELLARHGVTNLSGLDPSARMLDIARRRVPAADLRQGVGAALSWPDASIDRIFCVNALHHMADPAGFVAEARRVLDAGGGLLTVGLDPHVGIDRWVVYDCFDGTLDADRRRYPPAATIGGWLAAAGFGCVATVVAMHRPVVMSAQAALDNGYLDRAATSQLSLLSDAAYRRGIERITARIAAAEQRGETFEIRSDLRLYATAGWAR